MPTLRLPPLHANGLVERRALATAWRDLLLTGGVVPGRLLDAEWNDEAGAGRASRQTAEG